MHLSGRKLCASAFCVAGLAFLVCGLTNVEPRWPQYGFDARHTLFNPFERTLNRSNVAELSLQWEFMTGNGTGIAPLSGPALADGVLYVGSYAETTFRALDAETGAIRWSYTGLNFFSDPAVGSGHVYRLSRWQSVRLPNKLCVDLHPFMDGARRHAGNKLATDLVQRRHLHQWI